MQVKKFTDLMEKKIHFPFPNNPLNEDLFNLFNMEINLDKGYKQSKS